MHLRPAVLACVHHTSVEFEFTFYSESSRVFPLTRESGIMKASWPVCGRGLMTSQCQYSSSDTLILSWYLVPATTWVVYEWISMSSRPSASRTCVDGSVKKDH